MRGARKNPIVKLITALINEGFENAGLYYSLYRGIVYDRDDPENLQRLKLIIPQISGNDFYDYWAFPRNVYYGEGHGSQVIPQRGETVWVEFEGGRPEIPIWSHGHPARKEMPNDEELKDKDCYWFVTPKGATIKINDTKKTIHIKHHLGHYVEINKDSISIVNGEKNISLGSLNSSEFKALLGQRVEDVFNDMEDIINQLHGAMVKDLTTITGLGLTNLALVIPLTTLKVAGLKNKIKIILSDKVTLDK